MRIALVAPACWLLLSTGCPVQQGRECSIDKECADSLVCGRDHVCADPSEVRVVHAMWTINGAPSSIENCSGASLYISFFGDDQENDSLGFEPVPCEPGQFTVDKLPVRYDHVGLRIVGGGAEDVVRFDAEGNAQLDLPF